MRTTCRPAAILVLVVLALVGALPASAQSTWQPNGNPVCAAAGNQTAPVAIGDGANGIYVAWLDARPGASGVYAQRLLPGGVPAPGFPADGVLLSGATAAGAPRIMSDGAGGALVLWVASTAIYAQRLDANGALHDGWPANGKFITSDLSAPGQGSFFDAVTDGAGGAFFTRERYETSPFFNTRYIILSRIDANGDLAAGWPAAGRTMSAGDLANMLNLEPDLAGGVLIGTNSWIEQGTNPWYGRVNRVLGNNTVAYTMQCDIYFPGFASDGVFHINSAPDGLGGAYVSWRSVGGGSVRYLGQHVNSTGAEQWTEPYDIPFSELTVQDGTAGVYFVGRPAGTQRLEVHRREPNGAIPAGWTAAGAVLSEPSALGTVAAASFPTVVVVCWSEQNALTGFNIRVTSVRQVDGVIPPGWDPGGSPVCTAPGDQVSPVLVLQGASAFAAWEDRRLGTANSDIYASLIEPVPPAAVVPTAGSGFGILEVGPIPARDRIEISFAAEADRAARLEIVDVAGRVVLRADASPAVRRQALALGDLASGVYLVRLIQGARTAAARIAVVR